MTSQPEIKILLVSYLDHLSGVLSLMQGTAITREVVSANMEPIAPLAQAAGALSDLSGFLKSRAGLIVADSSQIKSSLLPFLSALSSRAEKMPSSAAAYYSSYGYLAFNDLDVLNYAGQVPTTELETMIEHLNYIPENGIVPTESVAYVQPIPGIELAVTIPGQSPPEIPYWISLTIRIKVEEVLLLVLAMRLVEQALLDAGNGEGFGDEVAPYLAAFATALTTFDQGQYRSDMSSLGFSDLPGSSAGSDWSGGPSASGASSSSEDHTTVSYPISSARSGRGTGAFGNSSDVGGGGGGGGGSSSSGSAVPRRKIVLIGMWPPSNQSMVDFSTQAPQPSGWIPSSEWHGWQGENWKNSGFDVLSFFSTFDQQNPLFGSNPIGQWRFRVDYKAAADDFISLVPSLRPVALVAVTRGGRGWKFEEQTRNLAHSDWIDYWGEKYVGSYTPDNPHVNYIGGGDWLPPHVTSGPITGLPPDNTIPAGSVRYSTLGYDNWKIVDELITKVGGSIEVYHYTNAGSFVSEWIGYLCNWYGDEMSQGSTPPGERCPLHGSIHINDNIGKDAAKSVMEFTLDSVIAKLHSLGY